MESNQELMILSLLNLYTSYINLKRKTTETPDKTPFYNRYATKQLQTFRSHKECQVNCKDNGVANKAITHNASITGSKIDESNFAVTTDKGKETSVDNSGAVSYDALNEFPSNSTIISNVPDSTANKEKSKKVRKRRRRGANITPEEVTEKDLIRKPRIRRWRVRPVNRDRALTGYHRKVFTNVKKMDQQQFFEHTRMSKSLFDWLLTVVQSSLRKKKQLIYPEERLAITLNYLAYGTSLQSIAWKHKVGKSTARQIVLDTCGVLWNLLSPIYVSEPTTSQFADIADDFKRKWNIPNCVGAIDGKLVSIRDPSKSAPVNNKAVLHIPIVGMCDTKYRFIAVRVGNFNKKSDNNGIFQLSLQKNIIVSDNLPLPSNKPISPSSPPLPHFFISHTCLPLRKNIMRPYIETNLDTNQIIFNYKISRAHTVTENTFGILTARFRVLLTTIEFLPENCKTIVLACIALHNFIMTNDEDQLYCPANFADQESESGIIEEGGWRNELKNNSDQQLPSMTSNDSSYTLLEANNLRNSLANLFANESTISYEIEVL